MTENKEVMKPIEPAYQPDRYLSVVERLAADPNVDIEKLQKIIEMKNREEDREAEQAFNADMVKAQEEIKIVLKNQKNTQTQSEYADLCAIIASAKPIYTKHGFALSFYPGEAPEGYVRVMVDIMHRDGHSKTRYYDSAVDMAGIAGKTNKTKIHGEASSFTYGRRYLTASTFNIPTGDDDGNSGGGKLFVDGPDLKEIKSVGKKVVTDENAFFGLVGAESWETIPAENGARALRLLLQRKEKLAKQTNDSVREPGEEG